MSESNDKARRVCVERNVYRRPSGVYEVGFKDPTGRQRWRTVDGGVTAARAVRDALLSQRARGERVANSGRLRFGDAAARWLDGPVVDLRPATQSCYRNAVEQHLLAASVPVASMRSHPTISRSWYVNFESLASQSRRS
jgi:hypothetical protein